MNVLEAYQTGVLDIVRERQSLADVLFLSEEKDLLVSYVGGLIMGECLLNDEISGEEDNYEQVY